jgi:ubiquinone/menaquinone biosynthesis C-methylase UbiE
MMEYWNNGIKKIGLVKSKHSKYYTANPISGKLVTIFFKEFTDLYTGIEVESVFDGGCGEGFILNELNLARPIKSCFAIDLDENEVIDASRNLPFCNVRQGNLYQVPFQDNSFDLVICSEVLEHLDNPGKGLQELHRVCRKYALLSVPREPVWRMMNIARFSYWLHLGNTPGHLNHWSRSSFIEFVSDYFRILQIRSPLPWTIVLGEKIQK